MDKLPLVISGAGHCTCPCESIRNTHAKVGTEKRHKSSVKKAMLDVGCRDQEQKGLALCSQDGDE